MGRKLYKTIVLHLDGWDRLDESETVNLVYSLVVMAVMAAAFWRTPHHEGTRSTEVRAFRPTFIGGYAVA